ncbi:MAG: DNA-directed RNA polymerase subunit alpha [Alphaproteobacteria bacterium]|nr:DNA-directed RNA polymerase subunit alpha [Alphaproteobacteria bacterium]
MIDLNWKSLIKPEKIEVDNVNDSATFGRVVITPLEKGFGMTLGVALRRVLLSSLQGAAVVGFKIQGAMHEFTSLPGMKEDLTEFVLNLKDVVLKQHTEGVKKARLKVSGAQVVTAGMIECSGDVEIINKDLVLCHLDDKGALDVEFYMTVGKGYSVAKHNRIEDAPVGFIPVDAIFSPIRNVAIDVDNARVGQNTDLDKLKLSITTDGSITIENAVALSARILMDQFSSFVNFEDPEEKESLEEENDGLPFDKKLLKRVEELELSVRANNCLKNDDITYIGELVQKTENDMLKTPNFGRKSLNEIKMQLENMGLSLGMAIEGWPPENLEELAKKYEDPYL